MTRRPVAERFWSKVNMNGPVPEHCPELGPCWLWIGSINVLHGYGQFRIGSKIYRAHRVAVVLGTPDGSVLPREIPEKMYALHECDNPPCVNPGHVRVDTPSANNKAQYARYRRPAGALAPGVAEMHAALAKKRAARKG